MSEFTKAVEEAREQLGETTNADLEGVLLLLRQAGVDEAKIAEVRANPSFVALIKRNPSLAQEYARKFPSTYSVNYYDQIQALGFSDQGERFTGLTPDAAQAIGEQKEFSATGAVRYPGGVAVDPVNQVVLFPPNDPSIAGSPAWMANVSQWDDAEVKQWRTTLYKAGYIDSKKGGRDVEMMEALGQYHQFRYLYGGGEPIDLTSREGGVTKKDFGGLLDKSVLMSSARTYFSQVGISDPAPEELDSLADTIGREAIKISRKKGYAPSEAATVAQARVQERFIEDPETQAFIEQQEDDEEYGRLASSILSLSQITGG